MWKEFYLPSPGHVAGRVPKGSVVGPMSGAVTTKSPKAGDTSLSLPQTYLRAVMDGDFQWSTVPCSSPHPLAMSTVPTGPNSTRAGDLWIAPQDTAAYHRPAADTRGNGFTAGHELGGGEASPCWAVALGASSLASSLTPRSPSLTPCSWCSSPAPHPSPRAPWQALRRRKELQKARAVQSYYEAKARRTKRIKSKK